MNSRSLSGREELASASAPWAILAFLFAGSGCAGLIYEVVWFQMLQLVIGSTAVSLGVLLGAFMGGLCLGSLMFPRLLRRWSQPLRLWALLELLIAVLGLVVLLLIPPLSRFYTALAPGGLIGLLLRGTLCGVCLLPPTILMGATLPAIARVGESNQRAMSRVGLAYGANTLGAMLGALAAGFVLLRLFNIYTATCAAAALNTVIGLVGVGLKSSDPLAETLKKNQFIPRVRDHWPVYLILALSGACALGAEVSWTRLLSLMLGSTTYTFSLILAVFLVGLGLGSSVGALLGTRSESPGRALGWCQLLLVPAIAWAAFMLTRSLPYWPVNSLASKSIWFDFQLDLLRCLWALLPATCLWGASFPLGLAAVAGPGQDPARLVGRLYAANTIGAIAGAVGASIFLVPALGSQHLQQLLIVVSGAAALLVPISRSASAGSGTGGLESGLPRQAPGTDSTSELPRERTASARKTAAPVRQRSPGGWLRVPEVAFVLAVIALAALATWSVPRVPWELIAYGRYLPMKTEMGKLLFVAEGMNASVAVTEMESGVRNFHVSGKIEASTDQQDMRLQRMLGHIPALFHPDPRSVLVVGCGAGVTAGSFLTHPGIERITLCEIEPLIPKAVARYFGEENYDVVQDPRVRLVYDDARHFIVTTREKFDVITSDPIHPWVKGAAALYTKEYFELCKKHLNPGGLVTQWVPLYESDLATVKSEIATFFKVFPEGTLWSNDDMGEGYDLVLLGQVEPLEVDVEALQRRLNRPDHKAVAQSLRDVGFRSAFGLVANYAGQARDLGPWLRNAQINHDRDLRLQYLAGLGLNYNQSDWIYTDLSSYRRFPQAIFVGAGVWNDSLKRALEQPKKPSGTGSHPKR